MKILIRPQKGGIGNFLFLKAYFLAKNSFTIFKVAVFKKYFMKLFRIDKTEKTKLT